MSLVQHVSAVEGVDRDVGFDPETASFHQLGRRTSRASLTLSYDPTTFLEVKAEERLSPIGAYEVSRNRRIGKEPPNISITLNLYCLHCNRSSHYWCTVLRSSIWRRFWFCRVEVCPC